MHGMAAGRLLHPQVGVRDRAVQRLAPGNAEDVRQPEIRAAVAVLIVERRFVGRQHAAAGLDESADLRALLVRKARRYWAAAGV